MNMKEGKKTTKKHDRYIKIGIWIVLSALVLTGLALIVGVVFDEIESQRTTIEEVTYLPLQDGNSRSTSTMSYGMAAKYSDGSIGALPDLDMGPYVEQEVKEAEPETRDATRGQEYDFAYSGKIVTWEVPNSGNYEITGKGASGGDANNAKGGKGRIITVNVELEQSQVLKILVGQKGGQLSFSTGWCAGGGGGTFIVDNDTSKPILVCGGGGGGAQGSSSYNSTQDGEDASAYNVQNGTAGKGYGGSWSSPGAGGTNGNGGGAYYGGSGGGGFSGNGSQGYYGGYPGKSFSNGGAGGDNRMHYGSANTNIQGGFGGGAGAGGHRSYEANSGGGGGYSGGGEVIRESGQAAAAGIILQGNTSRPD